MALDPDSELLIFKERGDKDKTKTITVQEQQVKPKVEEAKPVAEQQKPTVSAAPPVEVPKPVQEKHGFFNFGKKKEEIQKPVVAPVPEVKIEKPKHGFFEPKPKQVEAPKPVKAPPIVPVPDVRQQPLNPPPFFEVIKPKVEEQKPVEMKKEPEQPKPAFQSYTPTYRPEKVVEPQETGTGTYRDEIHDRLSAAASTSLGVDEGVNLIGSKKKAQTRSERREREEAVGKYCVWHPWRQAYATCKFCHRPFCFEDLVEEVGSYYCLEDIDRLTQGQTVTTSGKKSMLNLASGSIFLLPFVLLIYFEGSNITYAMQALVYAKQVGIIYFVQNISYNYLFALLSIGTTALAMVTGILIFIGSKKSGILGFVMGLLIPLLFAYDYWIAQNVYSLVIALVTLFAFGLLLAASPGEKEEAASIMHEAKYGEAPVDWANVGKF